jgi:hypothetical protein
MERDGVMAHGASAFLNDSFMVRGDEYYMAVCNKTGCTAIYNESLNLFLSPSADGPVKFNGTMDGKMNIENVSRFGRSFSVIRIPYSLKLLSQELQVMNIQMRIITEDNIDQLLNMSYSDNINKLLQTDNTNLNDVVTKHKSNILNKIRKEQSENNMKMMKKSEQDNRVTPPSEDSIPYAEGSPAYAEGSPAYAEGSPAYNPESPEYAPYSPAYNPETPPFQPHSPTEPPPLFQPRSPTDSPPQYAPKIRNPELKSQFDALPERDKKLLMKMLERKKVEKEAAIAQMEQEAEAKAKGERERERESEEKSVLEIEEPKKEGESTEETSTSGSTGESGGQTKSITISSDALEG